MTPLQQRELDYHTGRSQPSDSGQWRPGGWHLPLNPFAAAALARMGLLEVIKLSEHKRGERRVHWKEYRELQK